MGCRWLLSLLILLFSLHLAGADTVRIGPIQINNGREPHEKVIVGENLKIASDETVRDVTVVAGDVEIDGTVEGDVVVVLGNLRFGPNAEVSRDSVVVAGTVASDGAIPVRGEQTVVSLGSEWGWNQWVRQWFSKGLLFARPLPPQFLWSWMVALIFLLCYAFVALIAPKPLEACAETLKARPLSSFFVGLLVFLLVGPLFVLLAVTGIGLVLVPLLLVTLLLTFLFGKVAVYEAAGSGIGAKVGWKALSAPVPAVLLGGLLFCLLYAVPVLGFLVWAILAPFALGTVVIALFRKLSREGEAIFARTSPRPANVPNSAAGEAPIMAPPVEPTALPRAGFWLRLLATALDLILIGVIMMMIRIPKLALPLWVLYHLLMWTWKGTTIGGIIVSLKIVRKDGRPIDFAVALVRCLSAFFSAAVLFIGFFWAGWDPEKQAWHDRIAGTIVVKVPKGTSLI